MRNDITEVKKLYEFTNSGSTYGAYLVNYKGEEKVFIRNGDSMGVVCHYLVAPVSQCVAEVTDSVKHNFLDLINQDFDSVNGEEK